MGRLLSAASVDLEASHCSRLVKLDVDHPWPSDSRNSFATLVGGVEADRQGIPAPDVLLVNLVREIIPGVELEAQAGCPRTDGRRPYSPDPKPPNRSQST